MDSSLPRALHDAMSTRLGDGWLTGEGRRLYGGDDSRRWAMPSAVALPRTREDVVALVRACREHRVPLVARGAGTGTTGAAVPTQGGVVVSFARMDRILELRAADRCVVVEPGVLNGGLQQTLAPYGLFWPPDPSSADLCSVGGNLATNAGGPRAVKYGTARDNVLGLVAVTGTLQRNSDNIAALMTQLPPALRTVTDATGNGTWADVTTPAAVLPDNLLCAMGVMQECR